MAKPVKRPARVKAGNGHVRRGITPASIPFQSVDATVPRSLQVVIPKLGTETPTRTLSPGDDPPEVCRDATEHTAEKIYFREIGHFDRITHEEEVCLAKRIRQGDDEARQRMIHANLRLVVKIALDYEGLGLPLPDLINEGNIGLMKSVEQFDPEKGGKLSTYSSWWIKQGIKRALANHGKTIRLPVHLVEKIARMRRERMRLLDELRREPSDVELSQALGLAPRKVALMRRVARRPSSLDAPLSADSITSLGELVPDEAAVIPNREMVDNNMSTLLHVLIRLLPDREVEILTRRFGLDGNETATLEEIGKQFGVTRERVR